MIKRKVIANGLVADLFYDGDQPRKAIIMLGGSEGGKIWSGIRMRRPGELLVQRGYAVLSLAYFKDQGLPGTLEEIPLEYFEKALAWLSAQPGIWSGKHCLDTKRGQCKVDSFLKVEYSRA